MTIAPAIRHVAALAACTLALSLGTLMTAGPASAAATAGPPAPIGALIPAGHAAVDTAVSHLAGNTVQPLTSVHNCKVAGHRGTTQGVFCADVIDNGDGTFFFKTEAFCQNTSNRVVVECADINYGFEGASVGRGGAFAFVPSPGGTTHFCGHTAGPCPTGRLTETFPLRFAGNCDEVWTVVLAGARIQLPGSDKVVTLNANFASAHTIIC